MRVSIVGAGYVGLVSGACLAEQGHTVVCVDTDPARVNRIRDGKAPFHEPGLDALLAKVAGKSLFSTSDLADAVRQSELTLIAVGTPSRDDGSVDLGAIEIVSRQLGEVLRDKEAFHTVVVKSTVPPGTTDQLVGAAIEAASGKKRGQDFGLGMNPEFLTEGTAVADFRVPDRIVIGGADERTLAAQRDLYASFRNVPLLEVGNATAEMIKYMSNALLATMISFANEFADLCTAVGEIDAREVQRGVQLSRYLTAMPGQESRTAQIASFVEAGCGFGGSCLPKDVSGLASLGRSKGARMRLLESVLAVNAERPARMLELIRSGLPDLDGKRIAVLGLSFRPDTNDMRESPAIPIIKQLVGAGARVVAFDPQAIGEARHVLGDVALEYAANLRECVNGADAVVLVTRWNEFRELPAVLEALGQQPLVVDGRRLLDPSSVRHYVGIGALGHARRS